MAELLLMEDVEFDGRCEMEDGKGLSCFLMEDVEWKMAKDWAELYYPDFFPFPFDLFHFPFVICPVTAFFLNLEIR